MRKKNLRFHAVAISIISAVIVVLYLLIGPKPQAPVADEVGSRFVTITHATWGRNCDPYVAQALRDWRLPPAGSTAEVPPKPHKAQTNNALQAVSAACNGKVACSFLPTNESVGDNPLASCFKQLTVGYRCFEYDRINTVTIGEGETLRLDCREPAQ